MKKIILALTIMCIFLLWLFCFTDIGHRWLTFYHNNISLNLTVDGVTYNLKDVKVIFITGSNNISETQVFKDFYRSSETQVSRNIAKFKKGAYGKNTFEIVIPKTELNKYKENIILRFGQFNTNEWHKNNYIVNVEISQISENQAEATLSQNLSYVTDGRRKFTSDDSVTKTISLGNSYIESFFLP